MKWLVLGAVAVGGAFVAWKVFAEGEAQRPSDPTIVGYGSRGEPIRHGVRSGGSVTTAPVASLITLPSGALTKAIGSYYRVRT